MTRRLLLCFVLIFFCLPAQADSPPIPKSKTEALDSFKKRIDLENNEKENLKKKIKSIYEDLTSTKSELINIATAIQKNEKGLKTFEQRIVNLEIRKSVLEDKLHADRASIAKLILALERIRRTPPEALLARPDTPYKTAQSAMLMGSIVPSVNRHAEKLNKNLETLDRVTKELELEKETLSVTSKDLEEQHDRLSSLVSNRKILYEKTNDDIKAREHSIQKISLQAKNLEELVTKIKEDELKEIERQKVARLTPPKPVRKIIDTGKTRLPISGIIRVSYEQRDNVGATSKGLTIEGRAGALVIAPINGKIQFTGTFKRYGKIVIIEHANGYHSLVAGLDTISSVVGDFVKSGEPIGILPNSSLIPRPTLYYELRKNGKPINPSVKFPSLG